MERERERERERGKLIIYSRCCELQKQMILHEYTRVHVFVVVVLDFIESKPRKA